MGRNSINWNHADVQLAIDEYICRKIPTQAKLRQVISEILNQTISEQALSIYLKRAGVNYPNRKANSPSHSKQSSSVDVSGEVKSTGNLGDDGSGVSTALAVASLSVPQSLDHFYPQHHLFMNSLNGGGGATTRNAGGTAGSTGGSPANAVAVSSAANNTPLIAVDSGGSGAAANSALNFVQVSTSTAFSNILDMSSNALRNATNGENAGNAMLGMSGGSNLQRYILDDQQQQLHRAVEIQQNLQLQQQMAANHWHHQQQQQSSQQQQQQKQAPNTSNISGADSGASARGAKRSSSGASQPINWKDPEVQLAIQDYFNRKIKLQTELRQLIMARLKRTISENSLRLYLKKVKNQFEIPGQQIGLSDLSTNCVTSTGVTNLMNVMNHLSTSVSSAKDVLGHHGQQQALLSGGNTGAGDLVTINVNPSREIYYVRNNLAGFANSSQPTMAYTAGTASGGATSANVHNGGSTQQMLNTIESYGFGNASAGDLVGKQLQLAPPTMVKTMMINDQMIKVSNSSDSLLHQQAQQLDHSQHPHHSQLVISNGISKREKDDTKPSVRRRINWNNVEVQNAIQDFYGRKILTQAKLRSIIESILGHGVSEQALSIYLKRKKTRNPSSEELLLMNINCADENIA